MPIDASRDPYDSGRDFDLEDLERAGTGAGAAPGGKAIGAFGEDDADDDLGKAGKGAFGADLDADPDPDPDVKVFGVDDLDDADAFDAKLGLEAVDDLAGGDDDPLDAVLKSKGAFADDDLLDDDGFKDKDDDIDLD